MHSHRCLPSAEKRKGKLNEESKCYTCYTLARPTVAQLSFGGAAAKFNGKSADAGVALRPPRQRARCNHCRQPF